MVDAIASTDAAAYGVDRVAEGTTMTSQSRSVAFSKFGNISISTIRLATGMFETLVSWPPDGEDMAGCVTLKHETLESALEVHNKAGELAKHT